MKIANSKAKEIRIISGSEYGKYEVWFNDYKIEITHEHLTELMEEITSAQYNNVASYYKIGEKTK